MSREHVAVYLSTLRAIIEMIDAMSRPSAKSIRNKLRYEIESIRGQIEEKPNGKQDQGWAVD